MTGEPHRLKKEAPISECDARYRSDIQCDSRLDRSAAGRCLRQVEAMLLIAAQWDIRWGRWGAFACMQHRRTIIMGAYAMEAASRRVWRYLGDVWPFGQAHRRGDRRASSDERTAASRV